MESKSLPTASGSAYCHASNVPQPHAFLTSVCNHCRIVFANGHTATSLVRGAAAQRSLVLALAAHLKPMQYAPVTRAALPVVFHGTVGTATALKPPSATPWWPMSRPAGGTPRRCCGQAYSECGRMRTHHASSSSSAAARRGAWLDGMQAICQQQPACRPVRFWHWSVTGSPNCVSVRPQPRQSHVVGTEWPRQLGLVTVGAVKIGRIDRALRMRPVLLAHALALV